MSDLNGSKDGGNDFVLDDFALQPLLATSTKKFELLVDNCACDPVDTLLASYCGKSGTFRVKDKYVNAGTYYGNYEWYKTATSTTAVAGTTVRNGAQVQFSTLLTNTTGPSLTTDSLFTVYLKDVTVQKPTIMPTRPAGCGIPTSNDQLEKYMTKLTVYSDVTLKSVTAFLKGYNAGNTSATYTVNFYTAFPQNNPVPAITLPNKNVSFNTPDPNGAFVPVDLAINQLLSGTNTGTDYWIEIKAQNVNQGPLNCTASYPIKDNLGGTTVAVTGVASYGSNLSNTTGSFYNYQFEKAPKACPRVAVQVYRKCPPCDKPASVTIGRPKSDTTVCNGSPLTLKGTFTDGGNPIQYGSINYVWYKLANQASVATGDYKAVPVIDKNFANVVAATDSGVWVLRVEDGKSGNVDCYTEETVHIIINNPVIKGVIAMDTTLCAGTDAPAFTVKTATTGGNGGTYKYTWFQSAKSPVNFTRISGALGDTYDPGVLGDTALFYRRDSSGVCAPVNTNTLQVNMLKTLSAGKIGSDTSICSNTAPVAFKEVSPATGGDKNYKYQWQSATSLSGPYANVTSGTGASSKVYAVGTLTQTTYFRRVVRTTKPLCADAYSDTVKVTVITQNEPGIIAKNDSTCSGVVPTAITSLKPGSGSSAPKYSWLSQEEGTTTWLPLLAKDTLEGYAPDALTKTTSYRRIVVTGAGTCNRDTTTAVTIKVYNPIDAGTIGTDTTICSGNAPKPFKGTKPSGGIGTYKYQWVASQNGSSAWIDISAATDSSYTLGVQSVTGKTTVFLKRVVTSGNCPADTSAAAVKFVVLPPVTAGKIGNDTSICPGTHPLKFSELTAASGGDGNFTYKWQRAEKINGGFVFKDSTLSTNKEIYPVDPDTVETQYRRIDSSSTCAIKYSNIVTVKMLTTANPGSLSGEGSFCTNTRSVAITGTAATGGSGGTPKYFWVSSADGGHSWSVLTAESTTALNYSDAALLTDTIWFSRVAITGSGKCDTLGTPPMRYNIYEQTVAGAILKDTSICSGADAPAFTAVKPSKGNGAYHYKWYQNENAGGWNAVTAGAFLTDSSTLDPGALTKTTAYRRVITSGNCQAVTENAAVVTVIQNVPVDVTLNSPVACAGESIKYLATPINGGVVPTYKWYINGVAQAEIVDSLKRASLSKNDIVKVVLTSDIRCTVNAKDSAQVLADIVPLFNVHIKLKNPAASCLGTAVTVAVDSVRTGGNATYEWIVNNVSKGITNTYNALSQTFANNDKVSIVVTSDLSCAIAPKRDTSAVVSTIVYAIPTPNIVEQDDSICEGSHINYTVHNSMGSLKWYRDAVLLSSTDSVISIASSGKYFAIESRPGGLCPVKSDTVNVMVIPIPVANAGSDQYVLDGDIISLNGSGGGLYAWTPADSLNDATLSDPKFKAKENISFLLTVSDSSKLCSSTDEVKIFVERPIIIVNTFTPNGDGVNDTWVIKNIDSFPKCLVKIYNRWGNLVWESHSYPNPWDGTNKFNDQLLSDGTYFYIIELNSTIFKNPYQGWVQIIK